MMGLPQASREAVAIDALFLALLALCTLVALGVFAAMLWLGVRYRRGRRVDRGGPLESRRLELAWTLLPLALFVAVFVWSARLWVAMQRTPDGAQTVYVVARQWMWKVQHPGGQREINRLHVPVDTPVRLVMTSQDAIHSFYVPAFRLKQDVLPGRYTTLNFTATRIGRYPLLCAEYCGTEHAAMGGEVEVLAPAAYARWLRAHAGTGLAGQGAALYRTLGCSGCHEAGGTVRAPDLHGLAGRPVALADGRTVRADDAYLRDSLLLPRKDVAAGYAPIMPSYAGRIDESDVLALLAYLKAGGPPASERDR